jgi:hypothetical protein
LEDSSIEDRKRGIIIPRPDSSGYPYRGIQYIKTASNQWEEHPIDTAIWTKWNKTGKNGKKPIDYAIGRFFFKSPLHFSYLLYPDSIGIINNFVNVDYPTGLAPGCIYNFIDGLFKVEEILPDRRVVISSTRPIVTEKPSPTYDYEETLSEESNSNTPKPTNNKACIYGRIQVVDNFPDIRVQVVDNFPDLRVQVGSFPDACGKWQFVESFPDFKIQFVENSPDLRIQYVENFPGIPY